MNRKPRLVILPPQHLGHELHVGRSIVIDMIGRGFISKEYGDCVITGLSDRKFLYESLVGIEQVFDFSILPNMGNTISPPKVLSEYLNIPSSDFIKLNQFSNFDIINLSPYSQPPLYSNFKSSDEMIGIGYNIPDSYWGNNYISLAKQFNFLTRNELDNILSPEISAYIVIHHRYSASIEVLFKILSALPLSLPKVIFSSNPEALAKHFRGLPFIYYTDNLKSYSSLLNDARCKLLISEWSGGGQVGQYTLGPQGGIWYYHDHYPDIFNYVQSHKVWEHNSKLGSYFNCWDFKCVTDCDIVHYASLDNLLNSIRQIVFNDQTTSHK